MKKTIFVALIVMLLMAGMAEAQKPKSETVRLTAGSTSSVSGVYVWSVAIARVINKYVPGIRVTVVESGATYDNLRRMREGIFDYGTGEGWGGILEMYKGLETFEGNAWEPIRVFLVRDSAWGRTFVRADSGIKTWSDLKGKKLSGGTPGSGGATRVARCNEFLGTGAIVVPGSLSDAAADLQSGRLDAVLKSGPRDGFDAAMLATHVIRPLTVIGFSDEEAAKLSARYPHFTLMKIPAGTIKPLPKLGDIWEMVTIGGAATTSRLPEDVVYRMIKAIYEHWSEIGQAFPSCASVNPITEYVNLVPKGMEVPFHAGVVRYAKEKGINIPASLIPPEYKQR